MKKLYVVLGSLLLVGCTKAKPPDVPQFQTPVGWACARVCQREHTLCTSDCTQVVKTGCLSRCSKKLKECYDFCLADESAGSP
jgi:hypothetical protein